MSSGVAGTRLLISRFKTVMLALHETSHPTFDLMTFPRFYLKSLTCRILKMRWRRGRRVKWRSCRSLQAPPPPCVTVELIVPLQHYKTVQHMMIIDLWHPLPLGIAGSQRYSSDFGRQTTRHLSTQGEVCIQSVIGNHAIC